MQVQTFQANRGTESNRLKNADLPVKIIAEKNPANGRKCSQYSGSTSAKPHSYCRHGTYVYRLKDGGSMMRPYHWRITFNYITMFQYSGHNNKIPYKIRYYYVMILVIHYLEEVIKITNDFSKGLLIKSVYKIRFYSNLNREKQVDIGVLLTFAQKFLLVFQ